MSSAAASKRLTAAIILESFQFFVKARHKCELFVLTSDLPKRSSWGEKVKNVTLFPFLNIRGNFAWEQEIEFPIFLPWYKVCRIIHRIPMTFCVEFGFLIAQFNSPYPLHSSSYEFPCRTWVFHSPIFCAITVPMISLVELATCTKFSKRWEILSRVLMSWVWWVVAPPCLLRCVRVTMAALLNFCRRSRCLRWSG
jgi:hypothetical protein